MNPEATWTADTALLANVNDYLALILHVVARQKGTPPKPMKRPWKTGESSSVGGQAMTFEEADELAARFRAPRTPGPVLDLGVIEQAAMV